MAHPRHDGRRILLALCLAPIIAAGCDRATTAGPRGGAADGVIRAFVTIAPQAYVVERIAGDAATVDVLIPAGQSHHTYEPTPRRVGELARADVFFLLGVPFEEPLADRIRAGHGQVRIVDTGRSVTKRSIGECGHEHAANDETQGTDPFPGHEEGEFDPHFWLDPRALRIMAAAVRDELSQIRPDDANKFQRGFDALAGDLDDLHERISRKLAPFAGREFYVFHPALGYFADAYGLVQVSVEHEGKEPTGSRLAALQDRMNRNAATTLFVEPQFTSSAANALAERVGAGIVTINPLAGDYLDNLETMADRIAAALSPQSAGRDINPAPRDVTTRRPS